MFRDLSMLALTLGIILFNLAWVGGCCYALYLLIRVLMKFAGV